MKNSKGISLQLDENANNIYTLRLTGISIPPDTRLLAYLNSRDESAESYYINTDLKNNKMQQAYWQKGALLPTPACNMAFKRL